MNEQTHSPEPKNWVDRAKDAEAMCIRLWAALGAQLGGPDLPFPTPRWPTSPGIEQTLADADRFMAELRKQKSTG